MVHFRPGSQVWQLITLLSFVGEFPFKSLSLLGSERVYKALISRLTTLQTIRNFNSGDEITCRLLTISGKGARFPYWNGCIRGCRDITWTHSGDTDFPGTHLTGTGTTGLRKLRRCS